MLIKYFGEGKYHFNKKFLPNSKKVKKAIKMKKRRKKY